MTAAEYRERAERLLTNKVIGGGLPEGAAEEANAWALLAVSAAISETGKAATDGN
ncbi:hypothetical protein OHA61_34250 [Streptomyces sp. NBC_00885]|uniref:hypothetical protein n=1 Tax=Streptomyces sp. NBC_00885 TaxID=2975857 RepID=UPI0038661D56|nr:hypothetical protein OHA61_34250 [Streptomyces sp. NBC_00885]